MHVAVGHGEAADSGDAARAALGQALDRLGSEPARAALVFTGVGVDPRTVLDLVAARLPDVPLVGGTSTAELSGELGPVECSVLIVLFAGEGLEAGAGVGRDSDADGAVEQAASGLRGAAKLCLCLASGIAHRHGQVARTLAARLGPEVLVVGGGTSDEVGAGEMQPKEFFGREVLDSSVVVLLLGGELQVTHGIALGWTPIGETHVATKVLDEQLLVELDGRPAADVLEECLGGAGGSGVNFVHHPLAVEVEGGTLLRGAVTAGPLPGSSQLAGDIVEGARLRFCEFDRGALLASSRDAVGSALAAWQGPPPKAALAFECLTRWTVLGTSVRRAVQVLEEALPAGTTLAGAYVGGEIAPFRAGQAAHAHNCSIVVVLLGTP
jgi:hypothetical protein